MLFGNSESKYNVQKKTAKIAQNHRDTEGLVDINL